MTDQTISIEEIIGKKITSIRCTYGREAGWLDTAECFIELDRQFYIDIPLGKPDRVSVVTPDAEARNVLDDTAGIQMENIINRVISVVMELLQISKNPLKRIVNRTIVDYLWGSNGNEKGYLELDNGYFISDQYMAPHGTGQAGLHYYDSLASLTAKKGNGLQRYSEWKKG